MTTSHAERVASTVRAEMARRRVSQTDIAATLGLSQAAVSRRLKGRVAFDIDELAVIAQALGIDLVDLVRAA